MLVVEILIVANDECTDAPLDKDREGFVDFAFGAGIEDVQLQAERTRCIAHTPRFGFGNGIGRIDQQGDDRCGGQ